MNTPNAQRVRKHMARYDGVHLACFGTPDARFEHARLAAQGFEPEPLVDLQRKVEGGETVRFSVVYVPPGKMPEGRVQYCQHLTPRSHMERRICRHANGVTGLAAVYVVADDPVETAARWAASRLAAPQRRRPGRPAGGARAGLDRKEGNAARGAPSAPALAGYALSCRQPEAFARALLGRRNAGRSGVAADRRRRLRVIEGDAG